MCIVIVKETKVSLKEQINIMIKYIIGVFLVAVVGYFGYSFIQKMNKKTIVEGGPASAAKSIHEYKAKALLSGEEVPLSNYQGRVMLVVNTASKCGLTPQYEDLQSMHEQYHSKGLSILGFPSNDFMNQEPGSEEEIAAFCEKNYGVEFDMFEKVKVKGDNKHPVYQFLTNKEENGAINSTVQWNFQKYLLNKDGQLVAVFNPKVEVFDEEVVQAIDSLLVE